MANEDLVIGKDVVLEEFEPLSDLLRCLPLKAQLRPKSFVPGFGELRERGVKSLLTSLREKAQENLNPVKIEYTCFDVSYDVVVLGSNIGVVFLYDRTSKKLSKILADQGHVPVQCIKVLPAHSFVAVGYASGLVVVHSFVLASQGFGRALTFALENFHHAPVTSLEWSPDGTLLYTGDSKGKVFVTVVKATEGLTQTAYLFEESCPVVQISYSARALLVSSEKRTVIWTFHDGSQTQVGQKERKSPGKFGAFFYPPAKAGLASAPPPTIYTARPGLRLWTADTEGKVSATLMYKGLLNENPPGIRMLGPAAASSVSQATAQFGPLLIYHGQFVVTWDANRLWVLDTSPCAVVGFHGKLGSIMDVCTVGHDVYLLLSGCERFIVRISLIPKLANPLLDISSFLVSMNDKLDSRAGSERDEENEGGAETQEDAPWKVDGPDVTEVEENEVIAEDPPSPGVADAAPNSQDPPEDSDDESQFSKFQKARAEDYGDIVFKKKRSTKKKKHQDAAIEESDAGIRQLTEGVRQESEDARPDADDARLEGTSIRTKRQSAELSDLSSEFDSRDRSSSSADQLSDGETNRPRLTEITVTGNECIADGIPGDRTTANSPKSNGGLFRKGPPSRSGRGEELSVTNSGNQSVVCRNPAAECEQTGDDSGAAGVPPKTTASSRVNNSHEQSLVTCSHPPMSDQQLAANPGLAVTSPGSRSDDASSAESLSAGERTPASASDSDVESADDLLSPDEDSARTSYPHVYSNTPVNISDLTFSDASLDGSQRLKKHVFTPPSLSDSRAIVVGHSADNDSAIPQSVDSDRNTPPAMLDSEGAEELSDTASWPRSYSSRSLSYFEFSLSKDEAGDEGTSGALSSSLGSQCSSPESPKAKPNLRLLADSWADYATPSTGTVYHVAVSDRHLWCVTNYEHIFYCPTHFSPVTWTQLDGQAKMIAVNNTGDVIWCVDRNNYAHARKGIRDYRMTGRSWVPVEKDMRFVAVEETAVWGVKLNGDVFLRTDVSSENPQGKGWRTVTVNTEFVQVSCLDGLAWFVDRASRIHVYKGVDPSKPEQPENWEVLPDITAKCLCLGVEGVAWLIDTRGSIWFTGNVTRENPTGETWYQVSLGQYLMHDPTLPPLLVSTLTTLSSLWSWVKRGDEGRMLAASPRAGVWLLGRNGSLQASHGHLLGSRWEHVAPAGIAQSVFWSYVSANGYKDGKGHMWALQPNGELVCFHPADGRTVPVNSPQGALLKLVAASSQGVWGITHKYKVVQRLGITASCPEGYDWVDLNLHQFGIGRVRHLSCGVLTTWAVDDRGKMWVRIGSREETDPSVTQAWLHVEGNALSECHFTSVAVSGGDLVVWAVDDRSNVYARKDVTPSYPIGTAWELVPGMCVRDLSISEHMVWATCPNGDVACRYGVSEHNAIGDYWKKVPGNFELISVTPDDELWAINRDGQLFCRKTQHFYGTQSPFKARTYSTLFAGEEEWEFI